MLYFFIKIVVQIKPKIAFRSLPKWNLIKWNVSEANSQQIHEHYLPCSIRIIRKKIRPWHSNVSKHLAKSFSEMVVWVERKFLGLTARLSPSLYWETNIPTPHCYNSVLGISAPEYPDSSFLLAAILSSSLLDLETWSEWCKNVPHTSFSWTTIMSMDSAYNSSNVDLRLDLPNDRSYWEQFRILTCTFPLDITGISERLILFIWKLVHYFVSWLTLLVYRYWSQTIRGALKSK